MKIPPKLIFSIIMNAFKQQKRYFPEEKHLFAKILFYFYIIFIYYAS